MDLVFPWPYSQGEWLAFAAAVVTALIGLAFLLAPAWALRLVHRRTAGREAAADMRAAIGGFYAGFGLCAMLFAQPLVYMALGFAWAAAAFGRMVSILSDRDSTVLDWLLFAVSLVLAALPLVFAVGIVP